MYVSNQPARSPRPFPDAFPRKISTHLLFACWQREGVDSEFLQKGVKTINKTAPHKKRWVEEQGISKVWLESIVLNIIFNLTYTEYVVSR